MSEHRFADNPEKSGTSIWGLSIAPGESYWRAPRRINEIAPGTRAITANSALRPGRYFETTAQFWLNLQAHYDLEVESDRLGNRLKNEIHALVLA